MPEKHSHYTYITPHSVLQTCKNPPLLAIYYWGFHMSGVSKGTVGIEVNRRKIRLRLPSSVATGASRYISTGLDASNKDNHKKAQIIAWDIEEAIKNNTFNIDNFKNNKSQKIDTVPSDNWIWELDIIWARYCVYMRPQLEVTTFSNDYKKIANHINKLPTKDIRDAIAIRDYLLNVTTADSAKRIIRYYAASCKWAHKSGFIENNPFDGLAQDIKKPKNKKDIDPFTLEERDLIVSAFESHQHYYHYANFVKFLFYTGCRPGEAIALQWRHINKDFTEILFAESYNSGLQVRKSTKTGVSRRFPCNEQLRSLLISINSNKANEAVFTTPNGCLINLQKFSHQIWSKGILNVLVENGSIERYRTLYNTRHTFISHCLESGISVQQIAKWVGNSPEIIYGHYAGIVSFISVPIF